MKVSKIIPASNARNLERDKERVNTLRVVSRIPTDNRGLRTICEARFYMARRSDGASPVYCSLWVHGTPETSGFGKASGYGYHKESAALQDAIDSAGINLQGDNYRQYADDAESSRMARIDGCGETAMREAMIAIAVFVGADPETMLVE